ncbi:hypothetical protein EON65_10130 [archaeon]|nr:MAG: hypothetical protein EON65_10130 [archaeon]
MSFIALIVERFDYAIDRPLTVNLSGRPGLQDSGLIVAMKYTVFVLFLSLSCSLASARRSGLTSIESFARKRAKEANLQGKLKAAQIQSDPTFGKQSTLIASGKEHHGISFTTLVINIVADLCPHGMLPLAYGFASGGPNGLVPSVLLLALFATMSGYSMTAFASLAQHTNSSTIAEIWSKLFNPQTKFLVDLAIFGLCYGCCVFYSAFAGDIFAALTLALNLKNLLPHRWNTLLLISTTVLLPLCLTEDLSGLQVTSYLGVAGIAYTVLFYVYRLSTGSYLPGSELLKYVPTKLHPSHPTPRFPLFNTNTGLLTLANLLCVAFLAHYNSITYYKELNQGLPQYRKAVIVGFGIAALTFLIMMLVGYQLFGKAALPLILNNFPFKEDKFATLARLAIGLSITFAYPLMFAGLKSAMFNLLDTFYFKGAASQSVNGDNPLPSSNADKVSKNKKFVQTSAIITALASITSIAVKCGEEDVSVVLGIVGSVLGCVVAYCLPASLQLKHMRNRHKAGLSVNRAEAVSNHALGVLGAVFAVLGAWVTVQSASAHSGHHV